MVLPGHIAAGYLFANATLSVAGLPLSANETLLLLGIGTLAGELPDMDLVFYYFNQKFRRSGKRDMDSHRSYITHTPIFWLGVSAVICAIGAVASSVFIQAGGVMVLIGTWSHFLMDSIEYGIRWLWPFSNNKFALRHTTDPHIPGQKGTLLFYYRLVRASALTSITFYAEIIVTIMALWVAFHS